MGLASPATLLSGAQYQESLRQGFPSRRRPLHSPAGDGQAALSQSRSSRVLGRQTGRRFVEGQEFDVGIRSGHLAELDALDVATAFLGFLAARTINAGVAHGGGGRREEVTTVVVAGRLPSPTSRR